MATQLRSLSLSRYDVGSVACITAASQLTSLTLQHCSLSDGCLRGLASLKQLQRLELADNNLTHVSLGEVAKLELLVSRVCSGHIMCKGHQVCICRVAMTCLSVQEEGLWVKSKVVQGLVSGNCIVAGRSCL